MNSSPYLKNSLKDILVWAICFASLPFVGCFLYLNEQYISYRKELPTYQEQKAEITNQQLKETGIEKVHAPIPEKRTGSLPEDSSTTQTPFVKELLSHGEYLMSHAEYFWIIALTVLACGIFLPLHDRIMKKRASAIFNQLDQELNRVNSARTSLENYTILQRDIIQRGKEVGAVAHKSIKRVVLSSQGYSSLNAADEEVLIQGVTKLAEDLSNGIYGNYTRESLNVRDLIDEVKSYFNPQIQKLNLGLEITCSTNVTFMGDSLFTELILLNVIGRPLYSMPKNGLLSIFVTQDKDFVHVEVKGTQYSLSSEGKKYLKFPSEFAIETHKLQEICRQNKILYKSELKEEEVYTTLSFPLTPDVTQESNVIPFVKPLH
jgi:hypothetical protein